MKKLHKVLIATIFLGTVASCKKFIKEDLVSTLTNEYYKTDQGLEDLVRSAYSPLRHKFEGEQSYALWNFGDDEFVLGDQFNFNYYNTYDSRLGPADGFLNALWTNNYGGINRCNVGIEKIPEFSDVTSKYLGADAQRRQRVAELRFLRGFYYFQMVQQFGPLPVVLRSSDSVRTDFPRASVADVYNVILSDWRYAADNIAATAAEQGRITKGAVWHFLAKAYLTRGSAVNDQRGQKPTDMDSAAYYADLVINSGNYILEANYANLWNGVYANHVVPPVGVNGSAPAGEYSRIQQANASKEIIMAAQFNNSLTMIGANGNTTHLYWIMQYDADIPGLARTVDNWNGRPYRRMRPSNYTIDLFDRRNDSRFYKSFRTVYYSNTNTNTPKFTAADAPNSSLIDKLKYGIGDTAALFIVNNTTTTLTDADIAKYRYKVYARYYRRAGDNALLQGTNNNKYLSLCKHLDAARVTSNFNETRGVKNGTYARLAETYLIAAEAYGRRGNYTKALEYVNKIRQRAAWHTGETKDAHVWMFDGGTQGDVNDTYNNIIATEALFDGPVASENYPPAVGAKADRFIHFILNERTRELCGEMYRWEDLVRTETLYTRGRLFNFDATTLQPFHKLRPIPQQQIDLTTIDGKPMSNDQKQSYQNTGY